MESLRGAIGFSTRTTSSPTHENRRPFSTERNEMRLNSFLLLIGVTATTVLHSQLSAHEWKDKSGHYRVEAELVNANNELVILRTADHRLIAIDLVQLSDADQALVHSKMENSGKISGPAKSNNPFTPLVETAVAGELSPKPLAEITSETSVSESNFKQHSAAGVGEWLLTDGQRIRGDFLGFDLKPLSIKRALSEVYVGGVLFSQLDPIYQHILPMVIAHLENAKIDDVRDIEEWLKKSGPGPWTYKIEAVMIETPRRGSVAIPTFLLEKSEFDSIAVPLRRWREALASEVSEEEKNSYFDRERFMTQASMAARVADSRVEQQARYMRLELLAVASGATDLWNVSLIPNSGYGYPYQVLVPGQNSDDARGIALQRYPNYTVGGIARHFR